MIIGSAFSEEVKGLNMHFPQLAAECKPLVSVLPLRLAAENWQRVRSKPDQFKLCYFIMQQEGREACKTKRRFMHLLLCAL